jgi:glycosyltransferase involved in cell wall biosynthesis
MRVLKISHSSVVSEWRERERALRRRGVEVSLVTAKVWDEGGRPVALDAGGDEFVEGVRTWGRHPNVFVFDPRPIWRLLKESWDVIDIHEEPCSLAAGEILLVRLLRRSRAPFILYSAQNIEKRYPVPFRWLERWAIRHAAAVSVCNQAAGEILGHKGLRGQAVEIPLGVDIDHFRSGQHEAPEGTLRIGYVGRLARHKGVHVLIDSLVSRRSWHVDLVGAGPAESALKQQVAQAGLSDQVTFIGPLDQDALSEHYRTFDVVAVPSIPTPSWDEQFCRVAVEAMASGVPVVASRSGALPDVIGDAGLLVHPDDTEDLRSAFDRLVADPATWASLRAAGLERAKRFSWESVADDYEGLYQAVTRS